MTCRTLTDKILRCDMQDIKMLRCDIQDIRCFAVTYEDEANYDIEDVVLLWHIGYKIMPCDIWKLNAAL